MGFDQVEGHLAPFPTVIDFSLPNTRILNAEFVCLRKLPNPVFRSLPQTFQKASVRKYISTVFKRNNNKSGPTSPVKSDITRLDHPVLQNYWRPHQSLVVPSSDKKLESEGLPHDWDTSRVPQHDGTPEVNELQYFELIWKEMRPLSQIKRLKFETNRAG